MPKSAMFLPADLTRKLLTADAERDIRQATLDNILSAGVDLSTDAAVAYVKEATDAILAANQRYDECMMEVVSLAREKGGYDALNCSPIHADNIQTSGAVYWTKVRDGEKV